MDTIEIPHGAHLVGGEWVSSGASATSTNPARPDQPVGDYAVGDASTASDAVSAAVEATESWRAIGFRRRAEILERAAALFEERADELATIGTLEEGKMLGEMRGEAMLAAETCRYQAAIVKMPTDSLILIRSKLQLSGNRYLEESWLHTCGSAGTRTSRG